MFKLFNKKPKPLHLGAEQVSQADLRYLNDLNAAMQKEQHHGLMWVLGLLFVIVAAFIVWASVSQMEEVTRSQSGRIIPSSREQVIQSLDAGVLSDMLVKEGDVVKKGQELLKLDDTRSSAMFREGNAKVAALRASAARLRAEAYGTPLTFEANVPLDLQARERAAYVSRKRAMEDSVSGLADSKRLLDREISITEPMVAKGVMSEVELLRSKRQSNELQIQITQNRNKYRADADSELQRVEGDLSQAIENTAGRADSVKKTVIYAPLDGTIKNIKANTIGGVIGAGQDILEIVPSNEDLLVEAYIKPADVAFVTKDMTALVKLSAYDYSLYGGLNGTIDLISPDTLQDDKRPSQLNLDPNNSYYRVIVRINKGQKLVDKKGKLLPIIPGMIANVDIKTGSKTVLQYLIKPITRLKTALSER